MGSLTIQILLAVRCLFLNYRDSAAVAYPSVCLNTYLVSSMTQKTLKNGSLFIVYINLCINNNKPG